MNWVVLIKGGGDLGSGVAYSLHRVGMRVLITELAQPLVIRRAVSFASAIYTGTIQVEDTVGRQVEDLAGVQAAWKRDEIPVVADPVARIAEPLAPDVVIDATLAKRPTYTQIDEAPLVIGLGPGFIAGEHVHVAIETMRGHNLGRLIFDGSPLPDTGIPGDTMGVTWRRVLRAPKTGLFHQTRDIGDHVEQGETVAYLEETPIRAQISGVIRGLLWDGLTVKRGTKVGDIDPRDVHANCFTISDKARALGRAALEAILLCERESTG
jgi:xanthine dehydrogenase accessory factor